MPGHDTDLATITAALEAQFLMGHWAPGVHVDVTRQRILNWSWDADIVRQQIHVPANAEWDERVLHLEAEGLATFSFYMAPIASDAQGNEYEYPGWQDEPRDRWGSVDIGARGVLKLAELYGRPYVRLHESPAVLAHWKLVQAETQARLMASHDPAQWEREWPEQALLWRARLQADLGEDASTV